MVHFRSRVNFNSGAFVFRSLVLLRNPGSFRSRAPSETRTSSLSPALLLLPMTMKVAAAAAALVTQLSSKSQESIKQWRPPTIKRSQHHHHHRRHHDRHHRRRHQPTCIRINSGEQKEKIEVVAVAAVATVAAVAALVAIQETTQAHTHTAPQVHQHISRARTTNIWWLRRRR